MRAKPLLFAIFGILAAGAFQPALAQDCDKPLQRLASLPMTARGPTMTVPVSVNGIAEQFTVSTAQFYFSIAAPLADSLHLTTEHSPLTLSTVGQTTQRFATADLGIGSLLAPHSQFQTAPPGMGNGVFALMALPAYDYDFDFANATLNVFSNAHCYGHVVYWPHQAVAAVPFTVENNRIVIHVTLDGKPVTAVINSTVRTSLRLEVGRQLFGLTPGSPDMQPFSTNPRLASYQHHFQSLSFDGVAVANPVLLLIADPKEDDVNSRVPVGSLIRRLTVDPPDFTIGMDLLSQLHVYIALKEKKLYVTEKGEPSAPTAPANPVAAKP